MAQLKSGTTIGGRNIVQEFDSHKNDKVAHIDYAVASGTNTYTANIQGITKLVEGLSVKIKFQNANTGTSTLNINSLGAKEIRKSNGNALSSGNIKAGQILHLVYTGSVFQLLGEGGEYGTATPDKVLTGYTIGTENGIVSGTMPNNGAKIITPSTTNQAIPVGYHNGSGYVKGDANLKPENIKSGVSIFGQTGTFTSDATATASQILSGKTAYVNGSKVTGTMPNNSGKLQEAVNTYSEEGFVRLRPPKGYYDGVLGSSIDWTDGNFKKGNIKSGVTIFGQTGTFTSDATATASQILSGQTAYVKGNKITGTMPNNGAKIITPSTTNQAIPVGYHNGSGYVKGDANLKPENIKSGVSIFGVTGTYKDNLTFTPTTSTISKSENYCTVDTVHPYFKDRFYKTVYLFSLRANPTRICFISKEYSYIDYVDRETTTMGFVLKDSLGNISEPFGVDDYRGSSISSLYCAINRQNRTIECFLASTESSESFYQTFDLGDTINLNSTLSLNVYFLGYEYARGRYAIDGTFYIFN